MGTLESTTFILTMEGIIITSCISVSSVIDLLARLRSQKPDEDYVASLREDLDNKNKLLAKAKWVKQVSWEVLYHVFYNRIPSLFSGSKFAVWMVMWSFSLSPHYDYHNFHIDIIIIIIIYRYNFVIVIITIIIIISIIIIQSLQSSS